METLFKVSELESRIPLNMNVLVKGRVPKVLGLAEALARMARPSPRRAGAAQPVPARRDRAPARSAGRLPDRLSEPRQGDQDHPHRGRAEAGPDPHLQAHRGAGRCHPQHAAAQLAQARGDGDPARGQGLKRRVEEAEGACSSPRTSSGRRSRAKSGRCARPSVPRPRSASAAPPSAQVQDVEQELAEMLVEREPVTIVVSEKGWVRALRGHVTDLSAVAFKSDDALQFSFPCRDHVEMRVLRVERKVLHHRCREAAGRARPRRADAAVLRSRTGRRHRRGLQAPGRPQVPDRLGRGQGLRGARGRVPRQYPQGQAGAERQGAGQGGGDRRWSRAIWSPPSARTAR